VKTFLAEVVNVGNTGWGYRLEGSEEWLGVGRELTASYEDLVCAVLVT
jgi:hypothetical protein